MEDKYQPLLVFKPKFVLTLDCKNCEEFEILTYFEAIKGRVNFLYAGKL